MTEEKSSPRKGSLAPAGESSDPAVHQLLGERVIAQQNADAVEPDKEAVKAAQAELQRIDKALADLGYVI